MDKFAIAKFNGNDFAVWKFQMRAYLRYHELLDVVEGMKARPDSGGTSKEQEEWDRKDEKAQFALSCALETNVVRHIMNMKTAAEMWTRLVTIYEQKNKTSIHILHQKFYNYQMRLGATITEDVAAIEELVRQLEDLNQKPTDEQIITKVLYTLPQQYQHIAAAFDMLPEKEQTMVNLLPRLLKLETMRNGMVEIKNDEEENSALYTSNGNRGQRQHYQRNRGGRYQNQQRQQFTKQRFSGKCYNCGKTGHRKIDCYKPQNTQNNGQANAASNSGASSAIMYTAETMAVGNVGELWVADSGASKHMTFRRDIITNYREFSASERKPITVGNNETIYAEGEGDVMITSYVNGQVLEQGMSEVWYVPEIGKNLFSISAASNRGVNALFSKHTLQLFSRGKVVATGQLAKNGLFEMNIRARATAEAMIASASAQNVRVWHERLGHVAFKVVREMAKSDPITGMEVVDSKDSADNEDTFCEDCVYGKHVRQPFPSSNSRAERPGDLMHFDTIGPLNESLGGSRFAAVFTDDCSGTIIAVPMKTKSDVVDAMISVIADAEANGHKIKRVRSDNGGEFLGSEMKAVLSKKFIKQELTTPYCPQQNGRAERSNRTLNEMVRCQLASGNLPQGLWAEMIRNGAHIRNRIPRARLEGKTPYELWTGRKPDLSHLRKIGSTAYALIDESKRSKFEKKSERLILVGYEFEQHAYRLWRPGTKVIIKSRDVKIVELPPKRPLQLLPEIATNEEQSTPTRAAYSKRVVPSDENSIVNNTRSKTKKRMEEKDEVTEVQFAALLTEGEKIVTKTPETLAEALATNDSKQWELAMADELESLAKNEVWELVELPANRRPIQNKWIFKIKTNPDGSINKYKAPLVIKGCSQKAGIDYAETFSPVARFESVRVLLAIAAAKDYKLFQIDVKTAFLSSELKEEIYMVQPDGFDDGSGRVCKLNKSLYGLKQAPLVFHEKMDGVLKEFGMNPTRFDRCVYASDNNELYFALYVDDGLVIGSSVERVNSFINKPKLNFEVTGDVANCTQIVRDRGTKTLHLKQTAEHLVRNPVHHRRTKHIDVKFHYTREAYQWGEIDINHVGTTEQLADMFTKPLSRDKFANNLKLLNLRSV
ncbi:hypothetical protein Zmor_021128 [Zophobas morio]|uniref:Retrovirus-related Pol polyprotein from transposon TNT 1-94 n=1 Tax=Zophobas morio TaxID=2755281 RepID=A0AA38I4Y3_9CUCU|nr:hypothetical protein Zmor_021128 [Zophobas morio]